MDHEMVALELPILAVVAAWIVLDPPAPAERAAAWRRLSAFLVAGWLVEQSMIRAHGYHFYPPGWSLLVGHVPLVIVLAWPVVLDAAWCIARRLASDPWARVITMAVLVGCVATVWQPLAVHAGLVRWNASGPLNVPPIAVLGTALFAGATARLVLIDEDRTWVGALADVLAAVGATHLGVLATWHAGLGRLEQPVSNGPVLVGVLVFAVAIAVPIVRRRARLPRRVIAIGIMATILAVAAALVARAPIDIWLLCAAMLCPAGALALGHALAPRRSL